MPHVTHIYVACLCLGLVASAASPANSRFGPGLFGRFSTGQCGSTSANAVTTFQRTAADAERLGDPGADCTYTIRARSRRVCQLRIDFDTELALPGISTDRPYPHCQLDALRVDGLALELCGHNVEQHVYVPWDVQRLRDTKRIIVRTASRHDGAIQPATWRLRVTQIECADKWAVLPMFDRRSSAELRAPAGCLQYHTQSTGTVQSFNFNRSRGPYLGGLSYGICFRRQPQHSELRLRADFFEMSQTVATAAGYDADCTAHVITLQQREDFLAVREAQFTANGVRLVANRFCGTSIAPQQNITTRAPGPFMMQFSTDQQFSETERGFRFHYTIA